MDDSMLCVSSLMPAAKVQTCLPVAQVLQRSRLEMEQDLRHGRNYGISIDTIKKNEKKTPLVDPQHL